MTPDRLAEVLEALADGPPWDTAWLRSLLPELAVRGRLVAQEAGDDGWESLTIGEMLLAQLASVTPAESPAETFELWSVPAFADGEPEILQGSEIGSSKKVIPDGVTLLAKINPHLKRVWTVRRRSEHKLLASPEWLPLQSERAVAGYLEIALNSEDFVVPFKATAQGMGSLTRASIKSAKTLPIPLPPLAEQHRIVAKVDELMGHAAVVEARHLAASSARVRFRDAALHALAEAEDHEAVEAAWSRIEDHFDDLFTEPEDIQPLRQTILQLAVRGRLVAQEAGDEGARTLLKQIEAEKQRLYEAGEIKKPKSLPALKSETVIGGTPQGWCWCRFGEVQEFIGGFAFKSGEYQDSGVGIVRMSNLKNGEVDVHDMKRVPLGYLDSLGQELQVRPGDLLIGMSGSIGQPAFNTTSETFLLNQRVGKIVPIGISVRYVYFFLRVIEDEFIRVSFGSGIKNLSTRQILETAFPLPPLAEQHRIVAKVDELMALCDTLETSLERAKTTREQFAISISHALTTPESIPA